MNKTVKDLGINTDLAMVHCSISYANSCKISVIYQRGTMLIYVQCGIKILLLY